MLLFAALAMGSWKLSQPWSMVLYSRVLLSLGGMFVIALSTVACLGLISAVSIDLTPLSVSIEVVEVVAVVVIIFSISNEMRRYVFLPCCVRISCGSCVALLLLVPSK